MRLPANITNHALAVLLEHSGFGSYERFAEAVNVRAHRRYGIVTGYDQLSVKRWLRGARCQYPEVVADVLSAAWGISVPPDVLWPATRSGDRPSPAFLQPWVSSRTLANLARLVRSDMLTRRHTLAQAVAVAAGATLVEPISHWLRARPVGLSSVAGAGVAGAADETAGRIGMAEVAGIEQATRHFVTQDANLGGGLAREAAVGQLKYAVDLLRHGSFSQPVGDRLLAAVAELAGLVGWMSHDSGMPGPGQRYLVYGVQAARESGDERATLLAVANLADLARQMRDLHRPGTGLRLIDQALGLLPNGRRYPATRAMVWNLRGRMLAGMGVSHHREADSALKLAFDLGADADETEVVPAGAYTGEAELAANAGGSFLALAREDPRFATVAADHSTRALTLRGDGFARSNAFNQIELARARFLMGEVDQGCDDGETALELAGRVTASVRMRDRLAELWVDSTAHQEVPRVRGLRTRLPHPATA